MELLRRWEPAPQAAGTLLLTLGACAITALAIERVASDFAELRRVNTIVQRLDIALTGEDLTPVGNALREAEALREKLQSPAAEQALDARLAEQGRELAFKLQSGVLVDLARQFIENREYARARSLGQTVRGLVDYLSSTLSSTEVERLQEDSNLQSFDDIEGWIALRRFRASADNFTSKREAERIRRDYPNIHSEYIEVFHERALLKYNNGLRLLNSGDLRGAAQSFEVAVTLHPSQREYRDRLEEVTRLLGAP